MSTTTPTPPGGAKSKQAAGAAQDGAQQAKDSDSLNIAARAGLVAYGVVHLLIGWLALQLALGNSGGDEADQQGALQTLADTPIGKPLLWLVALGFLALVIWQLAEAAVGHTEEDGAKQAGKRAISAGKAVVFAALGYSAAKVAAGSGSSSGDSSKETFTAKLMEHTGGQALVGLIGVGIFVYGGALIYRGWKEKFREQLEGGATGGQLGSAIVNVGKVGYIAKGIAFLILGGLFVVAAIEHDPEKSGGIDDALKTLLDQPYGHVLVAIVGVGIACYGLYCFARARHMKRPGQG